MGGGTGGESFRKDRKTTKRKKGTGSCEESCTVMRDGQRRRRRRKKMFSSGMCTWRKKVISKEGVNRRGEFKIPPL